MNISEYSLHFLFSNNNVKMYGVTRNLPTIGDPRLTNMNLFQAKQSSETFTFYFTGKK